MLLGIGAITITRAGRPAELPYALIPAAFGVQQLLEGGLWLALANGPEHLASALTHLYQFFSHVFWPIYVPVAILLLEPSAPRRRILSVMCFVGAAVGLYLLYYLLTEPTLSRVLAGHIDYVSPHFYVGVVLTGYLAATCGSPLLSTHVRVRWFGIAVTIAMFAAAFLFRTWFISVWCFFAASVSMVVASYFLRRRHSDAQTSDGVRSTPLRDAGT